MVNQTMVKGAVKTASSYFTHIAVGIVILLAGFGIGILVKKLVQRLLKEVELNRIMARVGVTYDLETWVSSILMYLIYLVTIIIFLDHFNIGSIVLYVLLGAVLMLLILTFLVGLKDVIPNFIGWLYIQKKGNIKEGHKIEVKEISGIVEKIGYLETEIKTDNHDILYVPNSLFLKSKFKLRKKD
jgi:small-conductance mechanosensitive channel